MAGVRGTVRWKRLCAQLKSSLPPICWLCGKEIDLSVKAKDPKSWSLDHVKPLIDHPELAFVTSNLRPAHYGCNSGKGRGLGGDGVPRNSRRW